MNQGLLKVEGESANPRQFTLIALQIRGNCGDRWIAQNVTRNLAKPCLWVITHLTQFSHRDTETLSKNQMNFSVFSASPWQIA